MLYVYSDVVLIGIEMGLLLATGSTNIRTISTLTKSLHSTSQYLHNFQLFKYPVG